MSKTLAKSMRKVARNNRTITLLTMITGVTAYAACIQRLEIDRLKHRIDILENNGATYSTHYDDEI
jgi:hypothetical protein